MRKAFILFQLLFFLFLAACTDTSGLMQEPVVQNLEGSWHTSGEDVYKEVWQFRGDTLLEGGGFFLINDTLRQTEELAVFMKDRQLVYQAVVPGQNAGAAIAFSLKNYNDSLLIFTNPGHDFPNLISYCFTSDTSLTIEVKSFIDPSRNFTLEMKKE